jgi:hypothetical protein
VQLSGTDTAVPTFVFRDTSEHVGARESVTVTVATLESPSPSLAS